MKPLLLDLFCGAGGASMGYHRAGFEVIGVDINPMSRYPFEFIKADALGVLKRIVGKPGVRRFAAIHASPPCQGYSALTTGTNAGRTAKPRMISVVREALDATGLPYVIENVQGSDVRRDLTLCGEMFSLGVIRHRYFESNIPLTQPRHIKHRGRVQGWRHGTYYDGPYFAVYGDGGGKGTVAEWQTAMGINWTADRHELAEAIPPAYTEHIGTQLIEHIRSEAAA